MVALLVSGLNASKLQTLSDKGKNMTAAIIPVIFLIVIVFGGAIIETFFEETN